MVEKIEELALVLEHSKSHGPENILEIAILQSLFTTELPTPPEKSHQYCFREWFLTNITKNPPVDLEMSLAHWEGLTALYLTHFPLTQNIKLSTDLMLKIRSEIIFIYEKKLEMLKKKKGS